MDVRLVGISLDGKYNIYNCTYCSGLCRCSGRDWVTSHWLWRKDERKDKGMYKGLTW